MCEDIMIYMPYGKYGVFNEKDEKKCGAVFNVNNILKLVNKKPFYNIPKDKYNTETVELFINAIASNGLYDASVYLSKGLKAVGELNFDELKQVFSKDIEYKYLSNARFSNMPRNIVANSILILDNAIKKNRIVHVYMIKEPDIHGNWKICGIEQE